MEGRGACMHEPNFLRLQSNTKLQRYPTTKRLNCTLKRNLFYS